MLFEKIIKDPKDIVFIYTICKNKDDARNLGLLAIKKKLAISIDYWFVDSIYPWKGVLREVEQYMVMFSTKKFSSYKLMKYIEKEHPYVTPMIIRSDVAVANSSYESWVYDTLNKKEEYKTASEEEKEKKNDKEGGYHYGKLK